MNINKTWCYHPRVSQWGWCSHGDNTISAKWSTLCQRQIVQFWSQTTEHFSTSDEFPTSAFDKLQTEFRMTRHTDIKPCFGHWLSCGPLQVLQSSSCLHESWLFHILSIFWIKDWSLDFFFLITNIVPDVCPGLVLILLGCYDAVCLDRSSNKCIYDINTLFTCRYHYSDNYFISGDNLRVLQQWGWLLIQSSWTFFFYLWIIFTLLINALSCNTTTYPDSVILFQMYFIIFYNHFKDGPV